jgi:ABC-type branched-subunit amino acid transport system substrate-binding protein
VPKTAAIAANVVNTQMGGIDGHPVKIDVENDQGDATLAVSIAQKFVSMHAKNPNDCATVGQITQDPETAPLQAAVLNKAKIIMTASQSPDMFFNVAQFPYFFSVSPPDKALGEVASKFLNAHGLLKAAVLTDNIPQETEYVNDILAQNKLDGGAIQIIKTASMSPGAVQMSTQLAELRAANPDVLIVATEFGFGPIWQALRAMNWTPKIMGDVGFFYDGYSSLGSLAPNAWAPCWQGLPNTGSSTQLPPQNVISVVNQIGPISAGISPDPLIATSVEMEQILLAKWAIEKTHTVDTTAVKNALETMRNQPIWWPDNQFTYTPTYHNSLVGPFGAGICNAAPLGKIGSNQGIFQYADSTRGTY